MEIDLCVFFAGQNLDAYVPLFLETLYRNCDTAKLAVHVVEKGGIFYTGPEQGPDEPPWYTTLPIEYYVPGVGENVHDYLLKKKKAVNLVGQNFTIYEKHDPREFFTRATPRDPFWHFGDDHGNSLNWAMENCGSNKWIIFCHSDMVFRDDIIARFREESSVPKNHPQHHDMWNFIDGEYDWVGMFGIYNHCYAVNRETFFKVRIPFNCITNFRGAPVIHNGFDYELKHASDPKCPADSKIMYGFDIGELTETMMIANGWHCDISNVHPFCSSVDHMCSGHGYVNEATRAHQESRRQDWMRQYGVSKV